jgi:hypothetical protein
MIMKKTVIIIALMGCFLPSIANAQYWDWVTDEKSMSAFSKQYLDLAEGQLGQLLKYLATTEAIKIEQQKIAEKTRFIHMVRDSLFKSLQDVKGIDNSIDINIVKNVFGQVEAYYTAIYTLSNKYAEFIPTWQQYDNYIVSHSKSLLKMSDMAVNGHNEKNLLDKEQRLFLLSYVLYSLKDLREMSKRTLHELEVGGARKEYSIEKVYGTIEELYK